LSGLDLYGRFLLALVFVVALIGVLAWLARRFNLGNRAFATGGNRRLAIVETAPLDAKRRLLLVRRDNVEHLVLLGPDRALLIEGGIREAASAPFAAALRETA
jgi:flagellar protein FliO/FliZ